MFFLESCKKFNLHQNKSIEYCLIISHSRAISWTLNRRKKIQDLHRNAEAPSNVGHILTRTLPTLNVDGYLLNFLKLGKCKLNPYHFHQRSLGRPSGNIGRCTFSSFCVTLFTCLVNLLTPMSTFPPSSSKSGGTSSSSSLQSSS